MSILHVASELKTRLAAWGGPGRERSAYRRFLRGEGGAIAIYFGLSAIVFVGVAGLAVDAARGYLVKARLSEAIDAAALAGGKALQTASDPDHVKVIGDATAFFKANFPNGAMGATVAEPAVNIANNDTIVTVSSTATIPTTLMSVLGFNNLQMAAAATVARAQGGLDVVFSFDVSGSMKDPPAKLTALKDNATALVTSLFKPFTTGGQSQKVTVNGEDYYLLNIGVVPWNAKVNVRNYPATTNGTITGPTGGSFTNPTQRRYGASASATLPGVYKAANSDVPLLLNPNSATRVPGGWSGCVYARYTDDGNMDNDADTTLGTATPWRGWEPIPNDEGEADDCLASDWNNNRGTPPNWGWWVPSRDSGLRHGEGCTQCPKIGILRLQPDGDKVKKMINDLVADGNTDAPQGLFWAWEVLMPGLPFDDAKLNPPFQRAQAIVFMTDGQNVGGNGDAYHGWFGSGEIAGTLSSKGNITLPDGSTPANNLNNRLLQLAQKIKGSNPLDPSAVKIYVIQYEENDDKLKDLLKKVATKDAAPYYFFAPDSSSLDEIFNQIAESLSALRIVR